MKTIRHQYIQDLLPFVIIMTGAFLLYVPSFSGVWLMDDLKVLVGNPDIRSFSNFLEDYYAGRPLREFTYLLDYHFFGLEPAGYYFQNIFWHGLCAWLVFVLAKRIQAPVPVAWFSAFLFLLHPIQVEVIANTSHRKDSLALAFCLFALISYLRARAPSSLTEKKWFFFFLFFWGIALTAKQNALALPFVVVAYELYRLKEPYRQRAIRTLAPASVVGFFGILIYLVNSQKFIQEIGPALRKLEMVFGVTPENYFQTVFKAWTFMVTKLVYPVALSMEYTFQVPTQWQDPWVLCGLVGGVALVALFFYSFRYRLLTCLSLAWFLAFWLPTSNLLGHLSYFAADRYWYSPSVGLFLLVSYGIFNLVRGHNKGFLLIALIVLSLLARQTWHQQQIWCDKEVFYEHMQRVSPGSLEGFIGLGSAAMDRGDYDKAVESFQRAFQSNPKDGRVAYNLGFIAYRQGQYGTALDYFETAMKLAPGLLATYSHLGSLYDDLGQPERAIEMLERGLAINSHSENIYTSLGVVYERLGQLEEAEKLHRRAILERFDYGLAHLNLGNTLYNANRKKEAFSSFSQAIKYAPENVDALYNYAFVANELGRQDLVPSALAKLKALDPKLAGQLEKELE